MLLIFGFISVISLRYNNIQMLRLRDQVFVADEKGEDVEGALNELRTYVHAHMNTDLNSGGVSIKPPIQLKFTYERLVESEKSRVDAHNKKVTAEAPGVCEARFPAGQIRARAACVDEYIAQNSLAAAESVPKELYQFDFASPSWSPDLAGFSLLITAALGSLIIVRILLSAFIKHELK